MKLNSKLVNQFLKYISYVSLVLFAVLFFLDVLNIVEHSLLELKGILVVIYLFTSLKLHQVELKEKKAKIIQLENKLKSLRKQRARF